MIFDSVHPFSLVLKQTAPIIGANFELKSSRDSDLEVSKYPLLEYVIHKEVESTYDSTKKAWRVNMVVQLDYLLKEDDARSQIPEEELEESMAVQGIQFSITSKIRSLIQLITDPTSIGGGYKPKDFKWSKYDIKLEQFVESVYFRGHGMDELTGAACLVVLSMLDVDGTICCLRNQPLKLYGLLDEKSVSARKLKIDIDNAS